MPLPESAGFRFTEWMDAWKPGERRRAVAVAAGLGLPLAVAAGSRLGSVFHHSDTTHYLNLASGRPVMLPFASRQLGPLVVRGLAHLPGVSIERGFLVEGLAALVFFFLSVMFLLVRSGAQRWLIAAVAGMFFWAEQFNGLVLPDVLYAALLGGFLLLLRRGSVMAAALLMLPLAVARESTVLTLACFLVAGWRVLRSREILAALGSFIAGLLLVQRLSANALANQEHISPAFYLFAKMPWNFLRNFLGLNPWANVYPACAVPVWQHAVHLGRLQAVGFCGFEAWFPVRLAGTALASFGLLPLLLLGWVRLGPVRAERREELMVRFAMVYGAISFLMAGLLGYSVLRLFEYGWPLFLVALPVCLGRARVGFRSGGLAAGFVALHLALSWVVVQVDGWWLLGAAMVAYGVGWWMLRVGWSEVGWRTASHSSR